MPAQSANPIVQSGRDVCRTVDFLIASSMATPKQIQLALGTETDAFVHRWRQDRVMSAAHFRVLCRSRQLARDARRFLQSLVFDDHEFESITKAAAESIDNLIGLVRIVELLRPLHPSAVDAGAADDADKGILRAAVDQWMHIAILAQHMAGYLRKVAVRNGAAQSTQSNQVPGAAAERVTPHAPPSAESAVPGRRREAGG